MLKMCALQVTSGMKTRMSAFEIVINAINNADHQKVKCQRRREHETQEAQRMPTAARLKGSSESPAETQPQT